MNELIDWDILGLFLSVNMRLCVRKRERAEGTSLGNLPNR